jgi:nickel superoxide dismutase
MSRRSGGILAAFLAFFALSLGFLPASALCHCQLPCGIYDDPLRFKEMEESIATIEMAMRQVQALQKQGPEAAPQLIRWVANKEEHAKKVQQIVAEYFLTQRIKPAAPGNEVARKAYLQQIETLHQILVAAMKTRQSTNLDDADSLRKLVDRFKQVYGKQ